MNASSVEELSEIIASTTGKPVNADPSAAFGFDLFDLSEIVVAIEGRFGFDIPDGDLNRFTSMTETLAYIEERIAEIRLWVRNEE